MAEDEWSKLCGVGAWGWIGFLVFGSSNAYDYTATSRLHEFPGVINLPVQTIPVHIKHSKAEILKTLL
jgi:hypothetical protein